MPMIIFGFLGALGLTYLLAKKASADSTVNEGLFASEFARFMGMQFAALTENPATWRNMMTVEAQKYEDRGFGPIGDALREFGSGNIPNVEASFRQEIAALTVPQRRQRLVSSLANIISACATRAMSGSAARDYLQMIVDRFQTAGFADLANALQVHVNNFR